MAKRASRIWAEPLSRYWKSFHLWKTSTCDALDAISSPEIKAHIRICTYTIIMLILCRPRQFSASADVFHGLVHNSGLERSRQKRRGRQLWLSLWLVLIYKCMLQVCIRLRFQISHTVPCLWVDSPGNKSAQGTLLWDAYGKEHMQVQPWGYITMYNNG